METEGGGHVVRRSLFRRLVEGGSTRQLPAFFFFSFSERLPSSADRLICFSIDIKTAYTCRSIPPLCLLPPFRFPHYRRRFLKRSKTE